MSDDRRQGEWTPEPSWIFLPGQPPARLKDDPAFFNGSDYGGPHETTHQLNSKLRNAHPGCQAIYCLRGKAAVFQEPRTSLRAVALAVPVHLRGPHFELYLVKQARWWNATPSYVMDEWGAYCNGWECYRDAGRRDDADYSLRTALEFIFYAQALLDVVRRDDPRYDAAQLAALVAYQRRRIGAG